MSMQGLCDNKSTPVVQPLIVMAPKHVLEPHRAKRLAELNYANRGHIIRKHLQ